MKSKFLKHILFSEKGLRLGWIVLVLVLFIIIGEVLIVDPVGVLLEKIGLPQVKGELAQDWISAFSSVIKLITRIAVILLSTHLILRWFMKRSLGYIGLYQEKGSIRDLMVGIGLGCLIQVISVLLMWLMGWYKIVGSSWEFNSTLILGAAFFYVIFFCIETGVIEEILFRGFLIKTVSDRYNLKKAVIFSCIFFGLLHFSGFKNEFPWWASIVSATMAGFMFAQAFLLHRSLWMPIGIHFAWHLAARTLGTVGVAANEALCLVTEVKGPALLVNTKVGGAGGFELIGVAVVSLILWQMSRNTK